MTSKPTTESFFLSNSAECRRVRYLPYPEWQLFWEKVQMFVYIMGGKETRNINTPHVVSNVPCTCHVQSNVHVHACCHLDHIQVICMFPCHPLIMTQCIHCTGPSIISTICIAQTPFHVQQFFAEFSQQLWCSWFEVNSIQEEIVKLSSSPVPFHISEYTLYIVIWITISILKLLCTEIGHASSLDRYKVLRWQTNWRLQLRMKFTSKFILWCWVTVASKSLQNTKLAKHSFQNAALQNGRANYFKDVQTCSLKKKCLPTNLTYKQYMNKITWAST